MINILNAFPIRTGEQNRREKGGYSFCLKNVFLIIS